jgi:hypothetical protein
VRRNHRESRELTSRREFIQGDELLGNGHWGRTGKLGRNDDGWQWGAGGAAICPDGMAGLVCV